MEQTNIQKDRENLEKIKNFFTQFEESKLKEKKGKLHLTIKGMNGKTWKTTFELSEKHEKNINSNVTFIGNTCLQLKILDDYYFSFIQANVGENPCFSPRLESNSIETPNRITTTDVLQVLKLKLTLAHPLVDHENIIMFDEAVIKNIWMTPFRLLRGGAPFYEKYGYSNSSIPKIQEKIKTLKLGEFGEVGDIESLIKKIDPTFQVEEHLEEDLIEIMKRIDFETENMYNPKLSTNILKTILKQMKLNTVWYKFKFDPESPEWKSWNEKFSIINASYEENGKEGNGKEEGNAEGGGKHRKRTQTKRKRSSSFIFSRKKTNTKSNHKRNRTKKKKTMS